MSNIKIIKGVFEEKLELQDASIVAGFPSPADDYLHDTLDFNHDLTHRSEGYIELRHVNPDFPVFKIDYPD